MKFYYDLELRIKQITFCCFDMAQELLHSDHFHVRVIKTKNTVSDSPVITKIMNYGVYREINIYFCPYCGRPIKRYGSDEKSSQERVESLLNLPSDNEILPDLPSENSSISTGAVGAVNTGYDSLEKIEHELEIEHARTSS